MGERQVDVAIIGAGSAGLFALSEVRRVTDRFVLIDGGDLGTTCARVGCMPSKAMIQVADDFYRRSVFKRYGVEGLESLRINVAEAMEHVRDLRDTFVDRVMSNSIERLGDEFLEGYAEFVEPTLLRVRSERIRARQVVIATGSRPYVPAGWESFRARLLTTDNLFEQESLPESMAVLGMGAIGVELGQALQRMGVEVTGLDQVSMLAGLSDPEVNRVALDILGKQFPLWLGEAAEIADEGGRLRVRAGERSLLVDRVLVCMGRVPNLGRLRLDRLGVPLDAHGVPPFDPNTMQVADLPVFIAGDVTRERAILHEAADEGRIAGYNAAHGTTLAFKRKTPLQIAFCDPNIVNVGASWTELRDRDKLAVGEVRFGPVGRALIMAKNRGLLRVYAEPDSGRLLGASMVAPGGENLGHLLAWSIQLGLSVFDLLRMPFYHPVIEEALQAALYDLHGKIATRHDDPRELERA